MNIQSFADADKAIADFVAAHAGELCDDHSRAQLAVIAATRIPPARVANFAEFVFAHTELSEAAKAIGASVAELGAFHAFYGLAEDDRGTKIAAHLRGETVSKLPFAAPVYISVAPAPIATPEPSPVAAPAPVEPVPVAVEPEHTDENGSAN